MKKQNTTKRALLLSALSLLLCVSMLIGTTYAWFTDSVTSGNNKIVAGNLDVVLEYKNDWNDPWTVVEETTKVFDQNALYEPGYTEVVYLRVSNAGSLALKYKLMVDIASEKGSTNVLGDPFKLSEYLQIGSYVQDEYVGGFNYADILMPSMFGNRESALSNVTLNKLSEADSVVAVDRPVFADDESAQVLALVLTMPTTVGNEANYDAKVAAAPEINLGVTLLATQFTEEEDSFDELYDQDAEYAYSVSTAEELSKAIKKGGNIILEKDIAIDKALVVKKDVKINLNGHDLNATMSDDLYGKVTYLFYCYKGAELSFIGDGNVNLNKGVGNLVWCTGSEYPEKGQPADGSTVNIYGGNWVQDSADFDASINANYCEGIYANRAGIINIYGGTFKWNTVPQYTLNESRNGVITVYGGTFINFDPRNGNDANYVAAGYKVITETQANGDIWYTVVAE